MMALGWSRPILWQGQIWSLMLFMGKREKMYLTETMVVYDIKVGRYSQINEYMNLLNIKGNSLTFVQGHSDSTFSNFFSLETARPIEAKFHIVHGIGEWKWVQMVYVTWQRYPPCPYKVKLLKSSLDLESKYKWHWHLVCGIGYSSTTEFF